MAIFNEADPFNPAAYAALQALTTATRDTHTVHKMNSSWGPGSFYSIAPNADAPEVAKADFYIDPSNPPKDGDMLVYNSGTREIRSFIFDVKPYGNPADFFSAHMVQANPDVGIGHARKDSEGFSRRPASGDSSPKEIGSAFGNAHANTQSQGCAAPVIALGGPIPK